MKVSSKTPILVTGGASGLGLAVVEKFSSMGAKVAIFDMNDEEKDQLNQTLSAVKKTVSETGL